MADHHDVTALDIGGPADADFIRADITDLSEMRAAIRGHEIVIHVAARANVWSGTPEEIMHVNVTGAWNVFRAAELEGARRVVLCSTDSVIGFTVNNDHLQAPDYIPIDVRHPMNATDPYGISKVLGETIARNFALRGKLEVVVLRPVFILYNELLPEVRARMELRDNYKDPVAGSPTPAGGGKLWHYVDPRDAARAFRLAAELPDVRFETFFVCGSNNLYPEPTLDRLAQVTTHLPRVRDAALYAAQPHAPIFDLEHARTRLGYEPRHDIRALVYGNAPAPGDAVPS
jgi:nucleoside-diphosphate-sugar epimerase